MMFQKIYKLYMTLRLAFHLRGLVAQLEIDNRVFKCTLSALAVSRAPIIACHLLSCVAQNLVNGNPALFTHFQA